MLTAIRGALWVLGVESHVAKSQVPDRNGGDTWKNKAFLFQRNPVLNLIKVWKNTNSLSQSNLENG